MVIFSAGELFKLSEKEKKAEIVRTTTMQTPLT
jgi:hypothetical protein